MDEEKKGGYKHHSAYENRNSKALCMGAATLSGVFEALSFSVVDRIFSTFVLSIFPFLVSLEGIS